jgi:hypothetical protein
MKPQLVLSGQRLLIYRNIYSYLIHEDMTCIGYYKFKLNVNRVKHRRGLLVW